MLLRLALGVALAARAGGAHVTKFAPPPVVTTGCGEIEGIPYSPTGAAA